MVDAHDESNPSAISSESEEDAKQLKQLTGGSSQSPAKNNTGAPRSNVNKAKSCKGCLYYSSRFEASRNPVCVGLTRSLPNAPRYVVGELEMEAHKAGRRLKDFRYGCVGYSIYVDRKEVGSSAEGEKLPLCSGFEVLGDRRVDNADSGSAPTTRIHNRESGNRYPKCMDDFLHRFTRSANLVANGVAKNMRRVGNEIKQSLEGALYPHKRRP